MGYRRRTSVGLGAVVVTALLAASGAIAFQATLTDVTDFIAQWGGWLKSTDLPGDYQNHFWAQTSYAVKTANGSNVITITVTRNSMQRENKLSGQICSQGSVTTESYTFDPRYLSISVPTTAMSESPTPDPTQKLPSQLLPPTLWIVTLATANSLPVIRYTNSTQPPTCANVGQPWQAVTSQADISSFSIEFMNEGQAKQLCALLQSYAPSLSGWYPGVGGPTPLPTKVPSGS